MGESQQRCGSGASVLVQEVMEEEWTSLLSEDRRLPSLWGPEGKAEVGFSLSIPGSLYVVLTSSLCQMYGTYETDPSL